MNNDLIKKVLSPILKNDKIFIPEWCSKVKIDVGTSSNAPFSEFWLNDDVNTCVFGFEPNIFNIEDLRQGRSLNGNRLKIDKINKSFFLINCALSDVISDNQDFFCTNNDGGTSSLYEPNEKGISKGITIKSIIKTSIIDLKSFFDFFPWDKISYIEQLKIDAQGSDFKILKGCGDYLINRIAYIDIETSSEGCYHVYENNEEIRSYLEGLGFICEKWGLDATFFNPKFGDKKHEINYKTLH